SPRESGSSARRCHLLPFLVSCRRHLLSFLVSCHAPPLAFDLRHRASSSLPRALGVAPREALHMRGVAGGLRGAPAVEHAQTLIIVQRLLLLPADRELLRHRRRGHPTSIVSLVRSIGGRAWA
uniref:Uncharacterized protein n=1 Tax=Triticum urartu TaxID=4572 RepID=A0A8R7TNQ7_TRIUA